MCKYCLLKFKYLLNRNVHKALISIYLEDTTYLEFKNKFLPNQWCTLYTKGVTLEHLTVSFDTCLKLLLLIPFKEGGRGSLKGLFIRFSFLPTYLPTFLPTYLTTFLPRCWNESYECRVAGSRVWILGSVSKSEHS